MFLIWKEQIFLGRYKKTKRILSSFNDDMLFQKDNNVVFKIVN